MSREMRVKAIIMRPDHNNDAVILRTKDIDGKIFRHKDSVYIIDSEYFQITWQWRNFRRRHYVTYYYMQGFANPLPVPDFKRLIKDVKEKTIDSKTGLDVTIDTPEERRQKIKYVDLKNTVDLGVSGPELAALFNPWFYRVVAQIEKDVLQQLMFYVVCGLALADVYMIWLINKLQNTILAVGAV